MTRQLVKSSLTALLLALASTATVVSVAHAGPLPLGSMGYGASDNGTGLDQGSRARVNAKSGGNSTLSDGQSWVFSGPFMWVGATIGTNFVGFGVLEDFSGFWGSYWKRTGFVNYANGSIDRYYPPYDPMNNNGCNVYAVWYDNGSGVYRYSFNDNSDNHTIVNFSTIGRLGAGLLLSSYATPAKRYFRDWAFLQYGYNWRNFKDLRPWTMLDYGYPWGWYDAYEWWIGY